MRTRCRRIFLALALFLALFTHAWADDVSPMLSPAALQADGRLLRETLQALHPGLYRYNSPSQIEAHFQQLQARFRTSQSVAQAYLAFAAFTAQVKCSNTGPDFDNQPDHVRHAVLEAPRLPFYFRWLNERMVITRSFNPELPIGTQVLRLDGVPVEQILQALLPLVSADGNNEAQRFSGLEVQGRRPVEAFDVYWPLRFPLEGRQLQLSVLKPNASRIQQIKLPLQAFADRTAIRQADNNPLARWQLRFPNPRIALLQMPSWAVGDWDWRGFLQQSFQKLAEKQVSELVIDLRGNEGGADAVGDSLLGYLMDQSPLPKPMLDKVRYQQVPALLRPHLETADPSFYRWNTVPDADADGLFALFNGQTATNPLTLLAPGFRGRVVLLVDGSNRAASFQFAQRVRELRRGLLFGRPTGGNLRGSNDGAFMYLRLPGSGIEIDIPLVAHFSTKPEAEAGLLPDVTINTTPAQIAAGRDSEWEMLWRWLGR
ncbi:S41 family peptidase [Chitinimonas sp. BJB300]|uniref:S41 family peptidase n=1 Tax=Chitinimonas sp. BJB300 TaxID=1559339 RepID=UPI000C0E4794|nr:S41 family peptidase [Chitinimonas sp. BJB300]PHV13391.1 peptidase S41 [Chitinimonas sp. BJB300]TSJ89711.1 peptidase S41 [Chitinimonas sp. BJB300]